MKGTQVCTICASVDRERIEAAIAGRVPYREIAAKFQTSPSALSRHKCHVQAAGEPADTPKGILEAADAAIQELRVLARRARRNKNRAAGAELILKTSRELRAWLSLRSQLARRTPAAPIEETDPELDADQLTAMASALLQRHGKGKPN